jgi:hypothetical protein
LPDLIFAVRDLGLAELSAAARQREGARMLLVKADIGPASVSVGVEELTGDRVLAQVAKRLAIRAALILETVVDLGDASIRRAIASSNAISLYGLEFGFSADAKAGLAA